MNNHYLFNKAYFSNLGRININGTSKEIDESIDRMVKRFETSGGGARSVNDNLCSSTLTSPARPELSGVKSLSFRTTYPGLLAGTGYAHQAFSSSESIKVGFSFDYVSGLPYIPSSTVKGVLRSAFRYPAMISALFSEILEQPVNLDANQCKCIARAVFGPGPKDGKVACEQFSDPSKRDVFFDAVVTKGVKVGNLDGLLIDIDYITPHVDYSLGSKDGTVCKEPDSLAERMRGLIEPNPIRMLKVRPGVTFRFDFILRSSVTIGSFVITPEHRLKLYGKILCELGIGAKTNVGFGALEPVCQC